MSYYTYFYPKRETYTQGLPTQTIKAQHAEARRDVNEARALVRAEMTAAYYIPDTKEVYTRLRQAWVALLVSLDEFDRWDTAIWILDDLDAYGYVSFNHAKDNINELTGGISECDINIDTAFADLLALTRIRFEATEHSDTPTTAAEYLTTEYSRQIKDTLDYVEECYCEKAVLRFQRDNFSTRKTEDDLQKETPQSAQATPDDL